MVTGDTLYQTDHGLIGKFSDNLKFFFYQFDQVFNNNKKINKMFLYVFFLKDWYPGSDSRLMGKSVEKLLRILENGSLVDVVLPGHNDVIDSKTGTEMVRDFFLK